MTWRDDPPKPRGRLLFDESLAPFTWLRVGGPAEALFLPADEDDLAGFLRALPAEVPVTVLGVGSNLIVRDGGVEGVVIRLGGRAFGEITIEEEFATVGAAALDSALARSAAAAGVAGLEFYAGVPGSIGGAVVMNAGCYGRETRDVLVEAWGVDRTGARRRLSLEGFGYAYRHSDAPADIIWTGARFAGRRDAPAARPASRFVRRPAARPSRTLRAIPRGGLSTPRAGAASRMAARCSRPSTQTS